MVLGIIRGKKNIFTKEDRDRYVTAAICPYLLGYDVISFVAFSHLVFVFHAGYLSTFPFG